ncbi:MAG: hypothetical protein NTX65_15010 [Ignavibacteriales bacterium]|nr:hypothetical protein [Ignavibacteriales bacterium]
MNKEYRHHLENLDKVLNFLQFHQENYESIKHILDVNGIYSYITDCEEVAGELKDKGYISINRDTVSFDVKILPKGLTFLRSGGYIGELDKQEKQEELNSKVARSTIYANKANIIFAIINLIFFLVNIYLSIIK